MLPLTQSHQPWVVTAEVRTQVLWPKCETGQVHLNFLHFDLLPKERGIQKLS